MEEVQINPFTLQPRDPFLQTRVIEHSRQKTPFLSATYAFFAAISLLANLGQLLYFLAAQEPFKNSLILVIADIFRISFYGSVFLLSEKFKKLTGNIVYLYPLFYSVIISEIYIYTGDKDFIVSRIVSTTGLLMVHVKYTPINFLATLIPILGCCLYPFIRLQRTFLVGNGFKSVDNRI